LGNSLHGVWANILDVAARPFKQKTRIDAMSLIGSPGPLTACGGTSSVHSDGDGVPPETACHGERVTASSVQADDSYRDVLAVGVRSEAAGGGFFVAPEQQRKGNKQCFT
jgi:hypothetical protein